MQNLLVYLTDECCKGQACFELPSIDCKDPDCESESESKSKDKSNSLSV
jgi:hypothetical protein